MKPRLEVLEDRTVPAVASVTGTSSVIVRADGLSPTDVRFEFYAPDSVRVYDGAVLVADRTGIEGIIYTNTSVQPDTIEVDFGGIVVDSRVNIYTGQGNDSVDIDNGGTSQNVYVLDRIGSDTITLNGQFTGSSVQLVLGEGNDVVDYFGSLGTDANLTILGYGGNDTVTVDGTVGNNLYVDLGAGNDVFIKGPNFMPNNPSRYHEYIRV